jgi:type IV pilus assembly protein PilM
MPFKLIKKEEKDIQIGLDIGNSSVKACAVSHSGSKRQLVGFSVKPVGDNIIKAIKDAHAELGITKNKVATAISGAAVIVRYVEMPIMTDEELASATHFEAEKVIPYNINEVEIDSSKIENIDDKRMRVIIAAAKKDLIESHLKMISESALEAVIVDIDSFAAMNAFVASATNSSDVCGILNIGAKKSNLNIIKGQASYFSRDIDIAGNEITKAIAESLSLDEKGADKAKQEKLSKFSELSEEEKKAIETPLAEVVLRLGDEVRLSFDFYENHYAGNVNKLYVSGGTSRADIVCALLKEHLGRDALRWDPISNIGISDNINKQLLDEFKPQLAVVLGLALRRPA